MPGVPYEMKRMMENFVLPRLEKLGVHQHIIHKTLVSVGIGESFLSKKIEDIEDSLPPHIKLAYLPNYNIVRMRLTAKGANGAELQKQVYATAAKIIERVGEYIAIDEDTPMQVLVGRLLQERNKTIATAESCTGGFIAHQITGIAGSSAYYKGSVISYDNSIKVKELGVGQEVLDTVGAVSQETVEQMAKGILNKFTTDYSIATSGIAGPSGGTEEKPVGTVWIAVANNQKVVSKKYSFYGTRQAIIERSTIMGLDMVRRLILETEV